jgi:trypsin-like peptidase
MEERVSKGEARASDYAVAAETCLALGEMDEVSKWIASYIQEPGVDAFELSSLLWQFTKVWQPAKSGPIERKVLPVLRAEILRRESGAITLSVSDAVDPQLLDLEKVDLQRTYGAEAFAGLAWLQNGLEYSRAVGRIEDAVTGKVYGTAFLVQGLAFERPDCPWLLVTCASVTGPDGAVPHFSVSFEGLGIKKVPVGPVLFTSAAEELDVSLYEMPRLTVADVWPYRLSSRNVQTENLRRVYIIGHRRGGDLTFSMNNNAVLDIELPRIHYSTLTGPVTAGSPVFNQDWELVAVHHAGSNQTRRLNGHLGTYEANEAIWIGAVQHAFHKESRGHARAR